MPNIPDIETDATLLQTIKARAEALAADAEGFAERHVAPDVAHVLAFLEQHVTNAAAFESGVVTLADAIAPDATPEVQAALATINATAADANKLAAAFLAFLASKAPKSQTEPVTRR